MRIIAISDIHGYLIPIKESFDLLIIAGDICPVWNHSRQYQFEWLSSEFGNWVESLPFRDLSSKVLVVPGNHDLWLESNRSRLWKLNWSNRVKLLCNELFTTYNDDGKEVNIFGSPYCTEFGNWAFMRGSETLVKKFSKIPENLDILITHDAPYGFSDVSLENVDWIERGKHLGNFPLWKAITEKNPKYNIHGHIHSSNHDVEYLGDTKVYNVSILNENYEIEYKPLILDI